MRIVRAQPLVSYRVVRVTAHRKELKELDHEFAKAVVRPGLSYAYRLFSKSVDVKIVYSKAGSKSVIDSIVACREYKKESLWLIPLSPPTGIQLVGKVPAACTTVPASESTPKDMSVFITPRLDMPGQTLPAGGVKQPFVVPYFAVSFTPDRSIVNMHAGAIKVHVRWFGDEDGSDYLVPVALPCLVNSKLVKWGDPLLRPTPDAVATAAKKRAAPSSGAASSQADSAKRTRG